MGDQTVHLPMWLSTKIAYGGSNLQLNTYKLHTWKSSAIVFYLMVTKFILVLLSKNISKIRYLKSCILYHLTYTTIEALLYQPLRFILPFKSNKSIVSFGRKHYKYDMHRYFHASFLGIAFSSSIDYKGYTAQRVCKNNWLFVYLYKSLPSTCFVFFLLLYTVISFLCVMHLFPSEEARYFF